MERGRLPSQVLHGGCTGHGETGDGTATNDDDNDQQAKWQRKEALVLGKDGVHRVLNGQACGTGSRGLSWHVPRGGWQSLSSHSGSEWDQGTSSVWVRAGLREGSCVPRTTFQLRFGECGSYAQGWMGWGGSRGPSLGPELVI